jgi:hypothetical protein
MLKLKEWFMTHYVYPYFYHVHQVYLEPKHVLSFLVSLAKVSTKVSSYRSKLDLPNRVTQA